MGRISEHSKLASTGIDHGCEGAALAGSRFPLPRHWLENGGYSDYLLRPKINRNKVPRGSCTSKRFSILGEREGSNVPHKRSSCFARDPLVCKLSGVWVE